MSVAVRAGLPAARVEVERFDDYPTLVVERYDRTPGAQRIHQEDFAQALGTPGKYQQQSGPSLKECFEKTGVGGWTLWDQVMFAWIIGDEDKHAKNFSILYERGHLPQLAPIYDAVCTLAYQDLERGMAMRIGNTHHVRGVNAGAIRYQAARCGLDPDEAIQRTRSPSGCATPWRYWARTAGTPPSWRAQARWSAVIGPRSGRRERRPRQRPRRRRAPSPVLRSSHANAHRHAAKAVESAAVLMRILYVPGNHEYYGSESDLASSARSLTSAGATS